MVEEASMDFSKRMGFGIYTLANALRKQVNLRPSIPNCTLEYYPKLAYTNLSLSEHE